MYACPPSSTLEYCHTYLLISISQRITLIVHAIDYFVLYNECVAYKEQQ